MASPWTFSNEQAKYFIARLDKYAHYEEKSWKARALGYSRSGIYVHIITSQCQSFHVDNKGPSAIDQMMRNAPQLSFPPTSKLSQVRNHLCLPQNFLFAVLVERLRFQQGWMPRRCRKPQLPDLTADRYHSLLGNAINSCPKTSSCWHQWLDMIIKAHSYSIHCSPHNGSRVKPLLRSG